MVGVGVPADAMAAPRTRGLYARAGRPHKHRRLNLLPDLIDSLGLTDPSVYLIIFFVASLVMVWRLEAMLDHGLEGTALGTLIMPYCSGLGNIVFVGIVLSNRSSTREVAVNCLVNNVTTTVNPTPTTTGYADVCIGNMAHRLHHVAGVCHGNLVHLGAGLGVQKLQKGRGIGPHEGLRHDLSKIFGFRRCLSGEHIPVHRQSASPHYDSFPILVSAE